MTGHRIYGTPYAAIRPHYVTKVQRKGRTAAEVDEVVRWLTGYDQAALDRAVADGVTLERFFGEAPAVNPHATLITGVICGVRIEEIEDPLMRRIRYMDKLVDELARGRPMSAVLRQPADG